MVLVKIQGGLGNQLFQYALGRAIAERNRDELLLETSGLHRTTTTRRTYGLECFNITPVVVGMDDISAANGFLLTATQTTRGFHEGVLQLSSRPCLVLHGIWISERYFKGIEPLLRQELVFRDQTQTAVARQIRGATSVAIHVRRGDYLAGPGEHFGFVGLDYYDRAIKFMADGLPRPHFFVFSDDLDWCTKNLRLHGHKHTFVWHGPSADDCQHEDLRLMSLCEHFIIGNSTFSWWGAWLGSNPDKIIVAPRRWYRDDPHQLQSKDVIPSAWVQL